MLLVRSGVATPNTPWGSYTDNHCITIGDWGPHPIEGQPAIFHATVPFKVGDFRRWAPDHIREFSAMTERTEPSQADIPICRKYLRATVPR